MFSTQVLLFPTQTKCVVEKRKGITLAKSLNAIVFQEDFLHFRTKMLQEINRQNITTSPLLHENNHL